MNTNINELIYTLELLNPRKMAEIRERNPDHSELLQPGMTLGAAGDENTNDNAVILIKAEVCKGLNDEILKKCDVIFPQIIKRLKNHKKLNLLSQIVTAVCSATVITTIKKIELLAIIFGIIGLIASLIPLISEYIITGIDNKKINESFEELIKLRIEIEGYNSELAFFIKANTNEVQKISEVINRCNEKQAGIRKLLMLF